MTEPKADPEQELLAAITACAQTVQGAASGEVATGWAQAARDLAEAVVMLRTNRIPRSVPASTD